jgi:hypothetical protein
MYTNQTVLTAIAEQQIADRIAAAESARRAHEVQTAAAGGPRSRHFLGRRTWALATSRHVTGWARHARA